MTDTKVLKIDTSKPMFDSDGYCHTLVVCNGIHLVTKYSFAYTVWDAKTGECLTANCEDLTLSNTPLSVEMREERKRDLAKRLEGSELWNRLLATGNKSALSDDECR